jgi:hypothetical protein
MKILICGTRTFTNYRVFERNLLWMINELQYNQNIPSHEFELVSGGAKGPDTMAEKFAKEYKIPIRVFDAEWTNFTQPCRMKYREDGSAYNALAGFRRNILMANYCSPDGYCLAFHNLESPGTKDMISRAKKSGLQVRIVNI